ncbi:MAG: hypothetical protein P8P71_02480 [Phycisphaerales bacterium]|nr:hypothetical protein [Phycisphaerales bacterium]
MLLESTSSLPTAVPESLETSSTASAGSDLPPPSVEPEAIGPRDAVRGRVRDHPRQTVHPLGRRTKAPRSARLEPLVTDLKPSTPSPTPEPASDPTSSHQQLELDLPTTPDSIRNEAPAVDTEVADDEKIDETNNDRSEPASITTNPVTSRRWAMTWKPDADTTERNSQHPAARVTRENIDAATNQPSIPQVQSPHSEADATDPVETLVSEADTGASTADVEDAAEATTPAPEVASTPADTVADPEPIADATPTPVIEPAPATTEPAESDEPDESDVAPEIAAVPLVTTPARPTTDRTPADRTLADQSMPAPAGSGAIRVAAAGWIVAVLIGLGWLIASNQPARQTTSPMPPPATTATVLPTVAPVDQTADTAAITTLEAALADLEATSASASARISTLETELEGVRSDAAYLSRERSLLQSELEGLMELIEPPATATNDPSAGG